MLTSRFRRALELRRPDCVCEAVAVDEERIDVSAEIFIESAGTECCV